MIYKRIPPSSSLAEFVKEYLLLHIVYDSSKQALVKAFPPLPEHGIEFFPKGLVKSVNLHTNKEIIAPRNAIYGQQVSRVNFVMPNEDYLMIRVIFNVGGLFRLLGVPLIEFTDRKSDASEIVSQQIDEVNERLKNVQQYGQMIKLVEEYLLSKIKTVKRDIHSVDKVGEQILLNPSRFSLDWLASQAAISPRQLERKFVERMGVGPKLFSSITRFHKAFLFKEANPKVDWLSVAIKFGYTDFHHLYKDFKRFANSSPNNLLADYAMSPEKLLGLE